MVVRFIKRLFRRRDQKRDHTQKRDQGQQLRPIQLVIGLDFGTSFSKVVIGEERIRYAVPFKQVENVQSSLLIPSALCVLPDNTCQLDTDQKKGTVYDNLKLPLIKRDFSFDIRVRATAFVALLLKYSRSWLEQNHGSTYADRKIEWFVNVGLPTDSFDDEELKSVYMSIVRDAWYLSELEEDISMCLVEDFVRRGGVRSTSSQHLSTDRGLPEDRFSAFPEFLALLAGYVGTPRRRVGLHTTIDIGGGTLDFAVFNVVTHKDDSDTISIFARVVEQLGVRNLIERRLSSICSTTRNEYSPFEDLPSDEEFLARFELSDSQMKAIDEKFLKRIRRIITRTLRYTKIDRHPTAPQWHNPNDESYGEAIPSFYCGGGALSEFYSNFLEGYSHPNPPFSLESLELPVPDNLDPQAMAPSEFARLAVAYGLAIDPLNMTDYQRAAEIEDQNATISNQLFKERYIGKEQV